MRSFDGETLERLPLTHRVLRSTAQVYEARGKERLFAQQVPQALEVLRQAAAIQSTESSNRIEGIVASARRIEALVAEKTTPRNRSEQEIAGYRDVLSTIHASHDGIPFSTGVVLQFHRDLFTYTGTPGGRWKTTDNAITERHPDGRQVVRFQTVPAYRTPDYMERLHVRFAQTWERGEVDRLLLIPAYVLDFLCIHPFLDGNGRVARLLTLLLLYKAGFGVGRYISLEKLIEDTRESYYDALYHASVGWHEGRHSLGPWTEYFLGVMIAAYDAFERRVGELALPRGAKIQLLLDAVRRLPETFRTVDVERLCPGVSRAWIRKVFEGLQREGVLRTEGSGVTAVWRKLKQPR